MTLAGLFGDPKTSRDIRSAKRFNFFALLVLMGVIVGGFLLYLQLVQKQHELEVKTQQLADSTARLRRFRSELEAAQSTLAQREQDVERQLQSLSHSVENRQFDSAMVKAFRYAGQIAAKDSSEMLFVHLYAWQPQAKILRSIEKTLVEPDYLLIKAETMAELPTWMGNQSTVNYYSKEVEGKATSLAKQLTRLTKTPFIPELGPAEDAPQNTRNHWLRIHYLGTNPILQEQK
jgi:hypothetical protein